MTMRAFLAAILGGIAMFIWSAIAHMVLPLGEAGVREIPDEQSVLAAMKASIRESGFYIFPGLGVGSNPTREQRSDAMKRMAENYPNTATGILIYHPPGRPLTFGKWLSIEFVTELLQSILVVFLLTQTRLVTFASRVGFVVVAGILAVITTNISYWNWYGFPTVYTVAYMFIQLVGFLLVGLIAAMMLKPTAGVGT